jgi:hypothetical protein
MWSLVVRVFFVVGHLGFRHLVRHLVGGYVSHVHLLNSRMTSRITATRRMNPPPI